MSDRRMISTAIWEDEFVGSLTFFERLLWIGLITCADDQGRLIANANVLRSKVFLFDANVTNAAIEAAIQKFVEAGKLAKYSDDKGRWICQLVNWWRHQSPQWPQPSRYPAPDGWTDRIRYHTEGRKIISENWDAAGGFSSDCLPTRLPTRLAYTIEKSRVEESREEESREEGGGEKASDSGGDYPETPKQAIVHPDIQVFETATGRIPGNNQYRIVIDTIRLLRSRKNLDKQALAEWLKPFWLAWSSRKSRNGRQYDASNLAWLTEWAVNDAIPPEYSTTANAHESWKEEYTNA